MLKNIPTHVIAGPLGVGKTSLIRQLMAQRPADERWAVLINEFGQIGLDAALLSTGEDGIALAEVAGGCLCCVNGAPFQVGLGRLLRKAQPDRLFIEPSGLGHPLHLLAQLREKPWRGVLAVQPMVLVLDGQTLACGQLFPEALRLALEASGVAVVNKSSGLSEEARLWISSQHVDVPIYFTEDGHFPFLALPKSSADELVELVDKLPESDFRAVSLWVDPLIPFRAVHNQAEGWSIGWRWHPERKFDVERLLAWLSTMRWRRAKGIVRHPNGWISFNAVDNLVTDWKTSEWRKDSRLELIFSEAQDELLLDARLRACLDFSGA